jgi:hypothetical protein
MKTLILITGRSVMKQARVIPVFLALGVLVFTQMVQGQPKTPEEKIQNTMSAAPSSIAKDATIMDWPAMDWPAKEGDKLTALRKGTNAWTCLPDYPGSPGNDPMCLDKMWMVWLEAYMTKTEPKLTAPGIAYMLQGGSDASNTDPFATAPPAGAQWLTASTNSF